jgi:hypothetical protein
MAAALSLSDVSLAEIQQDPCILDKVNPSAEVDEGPRLYSNLDWKQTVACRGQRVRYVGPAAEGSLSSRPGRRLRLFGALRRSLGQMRWALRLLRASWDNQAVGLVRAYDRSALLFCFLRSFLFPSRGCVILFGFFVSPSSGLRRAFLRRALMGTTICLTWSRKQIDHYSAEFGVPREKFLFLPYKANHSAERGQPRRQLGDYLFSGGNSERDYTTLFEAVRGTGIPVIVSRTAPSLTAGLDIPENVIVLEAREPSFKQLMAGARGFVVCLRKDILRGAGEASFLNAMWHARPTIVADDVSAMDYIEDGIDGFVVPAGDVAALRSRILDVWNDPERAAALGRAGFEKVRRLYTHEHWKDRILKLAHVVFSSRS